MLLEKNIIANLLANGWCVLMAMAFVPVYVKKLGVESYGFIGFFAMLQGMLQVFDLGIGLTVNREVARYSIQHDERNECRDFVRTLEIGYWLIGVMIGGVIIFASPLIVKHWISVSTISYVASRNVVMLMGVLFILQWPVNFYQNGLLGLQRQVVFNFIKTATFTFSFCGAAIVVSFISATVQAFFIWQTIVWGLSVLIVAYVLWSNIAFSSSKPQFDFNIIKKISRFSIGVGGITVVSIIISYIDKFILSKMVSLKEFGFYSLATAVSGGFSLLIVAIFNALLPHFSVLVATGDKMILKSTYHNSCQLISITVAPIALTIIFFAPAILRIWLDGAPTASQVFPIVRVLVIGALINGFMTIPYGIQLAHGWTKLTFLVNAGMLFILVPFDFVMARRFGVVGIAYGWVFINAVYMIVAIPFMHRRILKEELRSWIFQDTLLPLSAVTVFLGIAYLLIFDNIQESITVVDLIILLSGSFLSAVLFAPRIRSLIVGRIKLDIQLF